MSGARPPWRDSRASPAAGSSGACTIEHPFEADANDHCETPRQAYADVAPLLEELARLMGKTPETLRIYEYVAAVALPAPLSHSHFSL